MGWLDALTDAVLGEAVAPEALADGSANEWAQRVEEDALGAEAAAAAGFDGEALRALIADKWGKEYDVEFTRTDYLGDRRATWD